MYENRTMNPAEIFIRQGMVNDRKDEFSWGSLYDCMENHSETPLYI
jgi:hypothetical protein